MRAICSGVPDAGWLPGGTSAEGAARTRAATCSGRCTASQIAAAPPVGEFRHVPQIGHGGQPFAVGTPAEVLRALEPYRGKELTHLSLNLHQPGQDSASVRRSMRLFARDIMPVLKAW